jgi:N-acetylglucosamine malate deacetylase 1
MSSQNRKGKTIVFAAHPDDEIIGCGGSLAKYVNKNETTIVYLTSGDAGSLTCGKTELSEIRENEAKKAASTLGISDLIFLRNPDGFLQCNKENLIKITNIIREKKPNIMYTHSSKDMHPDHKNTNELTKRASFMAGSSSFQEINGKPWIPNIIYTFEIMTPFQTPQYYEDITQFMDLKLDALKLHETQKNLHCEEWVEGLNKYRGGTSGIGKYAEAFKILRMSRSE